MSTESPKPAPLRVRVFLASPGDVTDERALALKTLESLEYDPFLRGRIHVETVAWDKPGADTPMLATLTPQEAIAQQRPKPSECDIVIVIFWSRMGTPLPSEYKKSDGSGYLPGTEWEYLDAFEAAQNTGRPRVLVYRRTEVPRFEADDPDIGKKLEQWQLVQTFFDTFRNPDGSIRSGVNEYDSPDTFGKKLAEHLKEIVKTLLDEHRAASPEPATETASGAATPSERAVAPPLWEGSPFPGLRPFGEDDASIYFGRGRETDGLVRRLAEGARFVTLVGASGSGKSSLVAAGLLPRLKDNAIAGSRDWLHVRFTPGELGADPLVALAAGFKPVLDRHGRKVRDATRTLAADPAALDALVALALEGKHEWSEVLLFVDQFEELFTMVDAGHRGAFAALIAHAATLPRLRTVATLRADFYHRCVGYPVLAELLRTGSYPLAAPSGEALHEVITRPAERAGLSFETELPEPNPQPALPKRILADVDGEPGALPLMAFALEQLYGARTEQGQLTHAAYQAFGGVKGAIRQQEGTFGTLDDGAKSTFPPVFRELIEVDLTEECWVATRRRTPLAKAAPTPAAKRLVAAFTEARLLVGSKGENSLPLVEVAHEALLREWPRLVAWIEDARDALRMRRKVQEAKNDWVREGRPDARRWKHEVLDPARSLLAEAGLLEDLERDPDIADFLTPEADWLLAELLCDGTDHARREDIGLRLAEIGDPRPGVGVKDGVPDILWSEIPAGEVEIGEHGRFEVKRFQMAAYPVTHAQFAAFIAAPDGFAQRDWWEGLDKEEAVAGRIRRHGNYPATHVSWFDATAFCRWLSKKLGYEVRLPDEWEWQLAAQSAKAGFAYPWGPQWQEGVANTDESGDPSEKIRGHGRYRPLPALPTNGRPYDYPQHRRRPGTGHW